MKKILLACLTLTLVLCLLPTKAQAATVDSGTCGDNLTWTLDDAGTLTISGTGPMRDYSMGSFHWGNDRIIKTLIIKEGVTAIGECAFKDCTDLTSVTISNSVTTIGNNAFYGCTGLTSMTLPNSVTAIGYFAFTRCTKLTSITIPNSVTTIGGGAFNNCTGLTSITIPDSVTVIEDFTFDSCTGLTSVTIPNSVTAIEDFAFTGCTGLTSITIPDSVTTIGGAAFVRCTGLTSVILGNNVTTIKSSELNNRGAFEGCTSLTEIYIPVSMLSIADNAFKDAPLKTVRYGGTKEQWESSTLKNSPVFSGVELKFAEKPVDETTTPDTSNGQKTILWIAITALSVILVGSVTGFVLLRKKNKA